MFQKPFTLAEETFTPKGVQDALLFALDAQGGLGFRKQISSGQLLSVNTLGSSPTADLLLGGHTDGDSLDLGGGALEGEGSVSFVARLDPSGAHVFSKALPSSVVTLSARSDAQGNLLLGGSFYKTANFGGDTFTVESSAEFLVKLGPSGEHLWSKAFTGQDFDENASLHFALDDAGNIYLTGGFRGTWDFGGGPVTSQAATLGYVIGYDTFLVKLDPQGEYLWGKYFGNGENQLAWAIGTDASGSVVIGGSFRGSIDFGAGVLQASSPLTDDIAVAKFSPAGEALWSRRFGAGNKLSLAWEGLAVAPSGHVILTGDVLGDIDFGTGTLPGHAGYIPDAFVVRLAP